MNKMIGPFQNPKTQFELCARRLLSKSDFLLSAKYPIVRLVISLEAQIGHEQKMLLCINDVTSLCSNFITDKECKIFLYNDLN